MVNFLGFTLTVNRG